MRDYKEIKKQAEQMKKNLKGQELKSSLSELYSTNWKLSKNKNTPEFVVGEDSVYSYCRKHGFDEIEVSGKIGQGQRVHTFICKVRFVEDGIQVVSIVSKCGTQSLGSRGYGRLQICENSEVTCKKCLK